MTDNTALQAAIAYFEDAVRESDEIISECSPNLQKELTEQKAHFEVALAVMRCAEPANEPLTLAELREIGDTPVWLVGVGLHDIWIQIEHVDSLTVGFKAFGDGESWAFRTSQYGKTVFSYRSKPEGARTNE